MAWPEGFPIDQAAIVSYDSEGTIELESGCLLVEVLAAKKAIDARFTAEEEDEDEDEARLEAH